MNELSEMLVSRDYCALMMRDRKECDPRSREKADGEVERVRTRERLDATVAGLTELEYLRQRQELLVRSVLNCQEVAGEDKPCLIVEDSYLNTEEKLLEENILLLRKQLVSNRNSFLLLLLFLYVVQPCFSCNFFYLFFLSDGN